VLAHFLFIPSSFAHTKVVVIAGTTAVGKTDLSLELARRLEGEVVSVDSVQVYRQMNVGSAKIDVASCPDVPHHLLDVVDVSQSFSALDYYNLAVPVIQGILSRGRVPLVVGGTGLYVRTLLQGPSGAPASTPETIERVEAMVAEDGQDWEKSLQRLRGLDPQCAESLEMNDWYRLKRALDICTQSGRTATSFKKEPDDYSSPFHFKCLFLTMPRVLLCQRIDSRCELIVEQGLFQEVMNLVHHHGLVTDTPAGRSLGYRQALEWLRDTWGFPDHDRTEPYTPKIPREQLKESFLSFLFTYKARTRALAQQQLTWHRKGGRFTWLNMAPGPEGRRLDVGEVGERVAQWLENDTPFPPEWDGASLMTLSKEEVQYMKQYSSLHSKPEIFSDPLKIEILLGEIESALQRTLEPCHTS
jgi:tRNA dimethylallyltransferase